ncbi:MAG: hypothetical protein K2N27_09995 [Ruminococcus sp.]|nr:hypothetical protein [Ruminococcus sp.]
MMKKLFIFLMLMAILVPSMLGYVKKSKEAQARYDEKQASYSYDIGWDD